MFYVVEELGYVYFPRRLTAISSALSTLMNLLEQRVTKEMMLVGMYPPVALRSLSRFRTENSSDPQNKIRSRLPLSPAAEELYHLAVAVLVRRSETHLGLINIGIAPA